jgi:hypothetical protein
LQALAPYLAEHAGKKFKYGVVLYTGADVLPFAQGEQKFYAVPVAAGGT